MGKAIFALSAWVAFSVSILLPKWRSVHRILFHAIVFTIMLHEPFFEAPSQKEEEHPLEKEITTRTRKNHEGRWESTLSISWHVSESGIYNPEEKITLEKGLRSRDMLDAQNCIILEEGFNNDPESEVKKRLLAKLDALIKEILAE